MKKDLFFCEAKKGCRFSKKNEHIFEDIGEEWEDYFETGKDEIDKTKFEIGEEYELLECYKEWKKEEIRGHQDLYPIAIELLKNYGILSLSKDKLDNFLVKSDYCKYTCNGIFLSALINKLYKEDEIHLKSNKIYNLGYFNKNKKIVVEGDCEGLIGRNMEGGEIIVEGDCGYSIGHYLSGGTIKICGGDFSPKAQISYFAKKGKIYHRNKLVWEDGKYMGDEI